VSFRIKSTDEPFPALTAKEGGAKEGLNEHTCELGEPIKSQNQHGDQREEREWLKEKENKFM